jgi:hypothetical protein
MRVLRMSSLKCEDTPVVARAEGCAGEPAHARAMSARGRLSVPQWLTLAATPRPCCEARARG